MKIRVLDSELIIGFIGEGFSSTEICFLIKSETEKLAESIKIEELRNWEVCFRFWYNNVSKILIYTKNKSEVKEKYKEITTHIPIPTKDKVLWGVDLEQHIYKNENHLNHLLKNFNCLDVEYSKFNNRRDYILDCMRRAIKLCFENGFAINGIKVKIPSSKRT